MVITGKRVAYRGCNLKKKGIKLITQLETNIKHTFTAKLETNIEHTFTAKASLSSREANYLNVNIIGSVLPWISEFGVGLEFTFDNYVIYAVSIFF